VSNLFSSPVACKNRIYKQVLHNFIRKYKQRESESYWRILKSSTDLISLNQNTIDFLMRPDGFIQYLTLYLCDKDTELAIRTACYSILSTFSALPNCYHLVDFSKHVLEIFLSALGLESDNENFCRLV
jgi:hypothetical protein